MSYDVARDVWAETSERLTCISRCQSTLQNLLNSLTPIPFDQSLLVRDVVRTLRDMRITSTDRLDQNPDVAETQAMTMVSHAFFLERSGELEALGVTCQCYTSLPWTALERTLTQNTHPLPKQSQVHTVAEHPRNLVDTCRKIKLLSIIHTGIQSSSLPEDTRKKIVAAYEKLLPSFTSSSYLQDCHFKNDLPSLLTALERTEQALSAFSLEDLGIWAGPGYVEGASEVRFSEPVAGWDSLRKVLACSLKAYIKLDDLYTALQSTGPAVSRSRMEPPMLQNILKCLGTELSHGILAGVVRLAQCTQNAHSLVRSGSSSFAHNGHPEIGCACGLTEDVSALALSPAASHPG